MIVSKINILDFSYYIAKDEKGYTFVGSPNGPSDEVLSWFKDITYVKDDDKRFSSIREVLETYLLGKSGNTQMTMHMIGTDFQVKVWEALMTIPYGKTYTYGQIAEILGDKNKTRAVASAIAKNPLMILIPCHRVIGKDKKMHGFRGGIAFKEKLLQLERDRKLNF
jgi:methylated-DNA-[protein]-cysteine S-methyltransferase